MPERGSTEVTTIRTQNSYLDVHTPTYSVASVCDGSLFEMQGNTLVFTDSKHTKSSYSITILSSGEFDQPNSRDLTTTLVDDNTKLYALAMIKLLSVIHAMSSHYEEKVRVVQGPIIHQIP